MSAVSVPVPVPVQEAVRAAVCGALGAMELDGAPERPDAVHLERPANSAARGLLDQRRPGPCQAQRAQSTRARRRAGPDTSHRRDSTRRRCGGRRSGIRQPASGAVVAPGAGARGGASRRGLRAVRPRWRTARPDRVRLGEPDGPGARRTRHVVRPSAMHSPGAGVRGPRGGRASSTSTTGACRC